MCLIIIIFNIRVKKVNMIIVEIDLLGARNGFLGRKKFSGHWVYLFLIVVHTVRASFLSVLVPKIFKKLVSVHEIVSKITAFRTYSLYSKILDGDRSSQSSLQSSVFC